MHNKSKIEWTMGIAAVVAVVLVCCMMLWDPNRHTAWGDPREEYRIHHPAGFSIVAPAGWRHRIDTKQALGTDGIYVYKSTYRYTEFLQISILAETDRPFEGTERQAVFQGQPAHFGWTDGVVRGPAAARGGFRFTRNGTHFVILTRLNQQFTEPPADVLKFWETFRVD